MDAILLSIINGIIVIFLMIITSIWILYWYAKNNILVDLSEQNKGLFISDPRRCRLHKKRKKFYAINDIFSRRALPIEYQDVRDFFIIAETAFLFSIKRVLNIKRIEVMREEEVEPEDALKKLEWKIRQLTPLYKYVPWTPPLTFSSKDIMTDFAFSFCLGTKVRIDAITKTETKAEMMAKVAVPMGLIILAICMIIFFPKIMEAIRDPVLNTVQTSINNWEEIMKGIRLPR